MDLNERKIKILQAIINEYIETGEPIGSRTIARKYDLGVSSATIRNEMSDLEEVGLILQPHTSSGRVPSDKGYRLYVDTLMNHRELTIEETDLLKNIVINNINHMDYLMEQTARVLSTLTNYATVVSKPISDETKISHIQFVPLDNYSIIAVVVKEDKSVKNYIIPIDYPLLMGDILTLNGAINKKLREHSLEEILNSVEYDKKIVLHQDRIINDVFKNIAQDNKKEEIKVYTSGINNILDFKEFSNLEKAKNIFQKLEEKDMLIDILNSSNENNGIQILIGDENNIEEFKECSIVKTEYKIAGATGNIGIIAPTRMDYAKTVSLLEEIVSNINKVLKGLSSG